MVASRNVVSFSRLVLQDHLITLSLFSSHFSLSCSPCSFPVPSSQFPVPHFKNIHFNLQLLSLLAQGQQGIVSPCGPQKQTCHSQAKCLSDKGKEQCRCNDGFQGDGTRCEGLCTDVAFQIPSFLAFNKKYQLNTLSKLP